MRVKISYGTEIENVPKISKELLQKSAEKLMDTVDLIDRCLNSLDMPELNSGNASDNIGKAREILSDVDLGLGDIQSLLYGLQKYYDGEEDVSDRRPTMDTGGSNAAPSENT